MCSFVAYFKFGDGWYKIVEQPPVLQKRRFVRLPESTEIVNICCQSLHLNNGLIDLNSLPGFEKIPHFVKLSVAVSQVDSLDDNDYIACASQISKSDTYKIPLLDEALAAYWAGQE